MKMIQFFPPAGIVSALLASLFFCHSSFVPAAEPETPQQKEENTIPEKQDDPYSQIMLLTAVIDILRTHYVDADKVTYERLMTGALRGMLQELDPFSAYDTPGEHKRNSDDLNGRQIGLGVMIRKKENNPLNVMAVVPDSSAAQAGVVAGDWIVAIDEIPTAPVTLDQCMDALAGPVDSDVVLTIARDGGEETRTVTVKRLAFARNSVPSNGVRILPGDYGYIRLESFTSSTISELDRALKKLSETNIHGLILDLRNNPGGLVDSALGVCDRFLKEGELIVFVEGREEDDRQTFFATVQPNKYTDLPMVILVNEHSASAAEIVSGCLKDHGRATLIGEKTFGKGSVQRVQTLSNNGAIRFTIAKYYTPSRNLIHGVGIQPDIVEPLPEEELLPLAAKLLRDPAELKIILEDGREWHDTQLETALFQLEKETKANQNTTEIF